MSAGFVENMVHQIRAANAAVELLKRMRIVASVEVAIEGDLWIYTVRELERAYQGFGNTHNGKLVVYGATCIEERYFANWTDAEKANGFAIKIKIETVVTYPRQPNSWSAKWGSGDQSYDANGLG